jgi:hypothetical protein
MPDFGNIDAAVVGFDKEIKDVAAFAHGLVYGNPLIDQIRSRGNVDPERIVAAIEQALSSEFGTSPARMPLQAIVFSVDRR